MTDPPSTAPLPWKHTRSEGHRKGSTLAAASTARVTPGKTNLFSFRLYDLKREVGEIAEERVIKQLKREGGR